LANTKGRGVGVGACREKNTLTCRKGRRILEVEGDKGVYADD